MEREWLPEEGEVALEAEQGALAESPGVTRRRREMQAFAAGREAPPPPPSEPAQEQTVEVHAPQGPLGIVFERSSTVLSRVKDSSPLLNKVQVGWTLVSVDGRDVSRMDGWAVTKEISARMHDPDGRRLKFKTGEAVTAGKALPAEAAGEALPAAEPAAPAKSPRLGFWAAGMAPAAGALARTSIEEQPVDGEVVTSPTSSENAAVVDAEALDPGETAQMVNVDAPPGPLGLDFQRGSTVLSEIEASSPLLNKVQVGWTLVKVDSEDVSHMNGSQVATRLKMRSRKRRHLEFKTADKVVDAEPASPAPDLTEEQRAALVAFAEMDTDGNGELSANEIHRALSKKNGNVSLARVKELVAKADTDGNGLVSKQEYVDAIAADLVPEGWLGALGRRLAQLTARAEPEPAGPITIDAPPGSLGLVFERESTVIKKVLDSSPLLNKVQVGWTLVSLNAFDVVDLDGWAVTKVLQSRADNPQRKLIFRRAPSGDAEQPGLLGRATAALQALSPRGRSEAVKTAGEWRDEFDTEIELPRPLRENDHLRISGSGGVATLNLLVGKLGDKPVGPPFSHDERIEADWQGRNWYYPGRIASVNTDETYDIKYDDGDSESNVPSRRIRPHPKAARDIVLHFNPRHPEGCVVRDSRVQGRWKHQERDGGYPFSHSETWSYDIWVKDRSVTMSVNGRLFGTFDFRDGRSAGDILYASVDKKHGHQDGETRAFVLKFVEDEPVPQMPPALVETTISIDDRRNMGLTLGNVCTGGEPRTFDERAAVRALQPAWPEKRAREFASDISDLVESYESEASAGPWFMLATLVFWAIIIYVMVITWLYFLIMPMLLITIVLFGMGAQMQLQNLKRKNKLVDDQIMELCRSQSDARVALTYVAKESGSFIDRKLQILPLVDTAAPTDDVLSPRDRSEDQPEGQPAPAETKTIIIDGNRDVGFWGSFPFGRGTDYIAEVPYWLVFGRVKKERAAGTVTEERAFDEGAALLALQPTWTEERAKEFASGMHDLVGSYEPDSDPIRWYLLATLVSPGLVVLCFFSQGGYLSGLPYWLHEWMLAPIFVGLWSWLSLPFQCVWAGVQRRNRLVDDRIRELCGAYSDERIRLAYNVKERSERTGSGDYADRELQIMRLVTDAAPSAGEKEMPAAPSAGEEMPAAPSAGEEELPEIEMTPQGASEEDIDLCGRKITLKHRFYGMGLLGGMCVLFQAVALVPTVRWADIEIDMGNRRRKLQSCLSDDFDGTTLDSQWTSSAGGDGQCVLSGSGTLKCRNSDDGSHIRTTDKFETPLTISGSLDKTHECSDHYIKLSTQSSDSSYPWQTRPGFVTFVWDCDDRHIYGQSTSVSTSCSSERSYDIEITVDGSTVTFRDTAGVCSDLSLTDSIGASGPLYVYVGADCDGSCYSDSIWHSVEVCGSGGDSSSGGDPSVSFVYVSSSKSWSDARAYCRANYYDLASIHSASENAEVDALCSGRCWIGGSDAAREDTWTWSDGTVWDYENWDSGEPNDSWYTYGEDHLEMYSDGTWNDDDDSVKKPFVCSATSSRSTGSANKFYLSYDLWQFYVRDDPNDPFRLKNGKDLTLSRCEDGCEGQSDCDSYCNGVIDARLWSWRGAWVGPVPHGCRDARSLPLPVRSQRGGQGAAIQAMLCFAGGRWTHRPGRRRPVQLPDGRGRGGPRRHGQRTYEHLRGRLRAVSLRRCRIHGRRRGRRGPPTQNSRGGHHSSHSTDHAQGALLRHGNGWLPLRRISADCCVRAVRPRPLVHGRGRCQKAGMGVLVGGRLVGGRLQGLLQLRPLVPLYPRRPARQKRW